MFLSPVLLLVAGIALEGVGFWRQSDSVAAIGAVAIVAALLLPRMAGRFEMGPAGIKGDLENETFVAVLRTATNTGLDPDRALELAAGATGPTGPASVGEGEQERLLAATGPTGATGLAHPRGLTGPAGPNDVRSRLVQDLAAKTVGESVLLERATAEIVQRVAAEKRWRVARGVRVERVDLQNGAYAVFDFVIETRKGPVFVETAAVRKPESLIVKTNAVAAALRGREWLEAFIVVPDGSIFVRPIPEVQIVEVGQLEERLREVLSR
jgi:hypothetical protein